MSGIYIHIPFCKKACHYCDFHFSTSFKHKDQMIISLKNEILIRNRELKDKKIESIYFGGGTPSVLSTLEINSLIQTVFDNYIINDSVEITLEANPDDLSREKILELSKTRVNRLSIGVQSFFQKDLTLMNRSHSSNQAIDCIKSASKYFDNISVDLIYGIPGLDNSRWKENIEILISNNIPHISAYALTVEPKTALKKYIDNGIIAPIDDSQSQEQFYILLDILENHNYENYELSNFAKNKLYSVNNSAYWTRKNYIGIGPSAHSFNGNDRLWNIKNNVKYIESINNNILPNSKEVLSLIDKFNETVMFGLRTSRGISFVDIENDFGSIYKNQLIKNSQTHINNEFLIIKNNYLYITRKGKFLSDGIASDLFMLN
ncbi:MAG: radical SAM family heme chaperone HemW [Flavobacteriales bacterium]|nr:radical SAM family heme chaperone HemW [Flavobacteriaceae bacterium]RZO97564.1 MAG: radical SAM family heme chaperone HemW [Flavobacteriales bacterium]